MSTPPIHQPPFPYIDIYQPRIASFPPDHYRVPQLTVRRSLHIANFYSPAQHTSSPQLYCSISAPSFLAFGSPYTITVILQHLSNAAGNPNSLPVIFDLDGFGLRTIMSEYGEMGSWLLLQKRKRRTGEEEEEEEGEEEEILEEINLEPDHIPTVTGFPALSEANDFEEEVWSDDEPEKEFVSMAVGESRTFEVEWVVNRGQGQGQMKEGERYWLCYRGRLQLKWRFGTAGEELRQEEEESKMGGYKDPEEYLWIPCSNLVEFEVRGEVESGK